MRILAIDYGDARIGLALSDESETLAQTVEDNGGVYLVPAFTGLGAPYWDAAARGTVSGITRGTTRGHIARAALESIAYQVCDIVQAMEKDSGIKITRLAVDGGASRNNFLLQFQSDVLSREVVRPRCVETTALGAAYLAGLAAGIWKDLNEVRGMLKEGRLFVPDMDVARREKLLGGWKTAVGKTLS